MAHLKRTIQGGTVHCQLVRLDGASAGWTVTCQPAGFVHTPMTLAADLFDIKSLVTSVCDRCVQLNDLGRNVCVRCGRPLYSAMAWTYAPKKHLLRPR